MEMATEIPDEAPVLAAAGSDLGEAEAPCELWDEGCDTEVSLDEILGEHAAGRVHQLPGQVSDRCAVATRDLALAQERGLDVAEYVAHCEGAYFLADTLEREAARLRASGTHDPATDLLEWDAALEEAVFDLLERLEIVVPILDDILVLANQDGLRALADVIDEWATAGAERIELVMIHAQTGFTLMEQLVTRFAEHQDAYERHMKDAKMDVASLVVGPLMKLAELPEDLRRLYTLGKAFGKIGKEVRSPWDAIRTFRSVGSAAAGEFARSLGRENPFGQAWTPLSTLLKTCQTIVDLGLAGTDLAMMQADLGFARTVHEEFGKAMAYVGVLEPVLSHALSVLGRLSGLSERVDSALMALDAKVSAAGGMGLYQVGY